MNYFDDKTSDNIRVVHIRTVYKYLTAKFFRYHGQVEYKINKSFRDMEGHFKVVGG